MSDHGRSLFPQAGFELLNLVEQPRLLNRPQRPVAETNGIKGIDQGLRQFEQSRRVEWCGECLLQIACEFSRRLIESDPLAVLCGTLQESLEKFDSRCDDFALFPFEARKGARLPWPQDPQSCGIPHTPQAPDKRRGQTQQ